MEVGGIIRETRFYSPNESPVEFMNFTVRTLLN
jgi:hypothetical protein